VGAVLTLKEVTTMKRYQYPLHPDSQLAWWCGLTAIAFGLVATVTFLISDGFGVGAIVFGAMFLIGLVWTWIVWYTSDDELHREVLRRRDQGGRR
jgi:hypothetical protein